MAPVTWQTESPDRGINVTEQARSPDDRFAIQDTLNTYARACDERDWDEFERVFCADVSVDYGGGFKLDGRDNVVAMIQSMLGGCGPTQHLLGNFDVSFRDDEAHTRIYVRAVHAGLDSEQDTLYEVWAEYHDVFVATEAGWRIKQRQMLVHKEVGTRDILRPG